MAAATARKSKIDKALNKKRKGRLVMAQAWLKRFGMGLGLLAGLIWLGAWLVLSGAAERGVVFAHERVLEASAGMGFAVENIILEGREYADAGAIAALLNMERGDPLFALKPDEAQSLLSEITWVEHIKVERRLPDTIYVRLKEFEPFAVYHEGDSRVLINPEGRFITDYKLSRFDELIRLSGENSLEHMAELRDLMTAEEELASRVKAAERVGDRRWDLIFDSDVRVKLPESDLGFAMRRLAEAQEQGRVLDQSLQSIDLREVDRIVVRTRPGQVKNLKADFKL